MLGWAEFVALAAVWALTAALFVMAWTVAPGVLVMAVGLAGGALAATAVVIYTRTLG